MDESFRPSGFTPAFGRMEALRGGSFDARAKARAYLRINGKNEIQGFFPFGSAQCQNDGVERTNSKSSSNSNYNGNTTAKAETYPFGMTNKRGKGKGNSAVWGVLYIPISGAVRCV